MVNSMKWLIIFALLLPFSSQAAIFDAPDILSENSGAVGIFGEMILNNPTSEGIEARGRYGLSEDWDVAAILGTGSNGKKLRFGGETVFNIIPDWEGQIGLSVLASALYLRRFASGGVQVRAGIMGHKKFQSWTGLPATVYLAVPFQLDARSGSYTTGSQIVIGSLWDLNTQSRFYASTELGIKMGRAESYVLLGAGFRLGELRFERRGTAPARQKKAPGEPEFREEDFL